MTYNLPMFLNKNSGHQAVNPDEMKELFWKVEEEFDTRMLRAIIEKPPGKEVTAIERTQIREQIIKELTS